MRANLLVVGAVGGLVLLVAACGGGGGGSSNAARAPGDAPPEIKDHADQWPAPNGDLANTRVSAGEISADNVSKLGVAWTAPIEATGTFGGYASTPLVAGDTVYTQDLNSNVTAYALNDGHVLWRHRFDVPDLGPNGLALGYGRVFGATADFAFALDAESGDQVWRSQKLTRNANEGIDMAPSVYDHFVYVSTVPGNAKGFYKGNGVGTIFALDADSGQEKWRFHTVPLDLWSPEHKDINSGGGLWYSPAVDGDGALYADVANPAPWPGTNELPWGTSRPGPNLYTNSILKLDHATGKLDWYRQVLPHDVYDWDLQVSPVLAHTGDRDVVVAAGKLGYVVAADTETGDVLWKRAVGRHNGHDQDWRAALRGDLAAMPKLPVTVLPGVLGGVETQLAVADDTVYAAIVNLPVTFVDQETPKIDFNSGTGQMVAIDLASGRIKWDTKLPAPAYGAATVSNDLVFTTTFDGKVLAFDRDSGKIVWTEQLPTGTNATVAISGDTLLTAASVPHGDVRAQIVALRLGASGSYLGGGGTTTTTPTTTSGGGGGGDQLAVGEQVFKDNCASCHTLAAAGASANVGPNLDQAHPDAATVKRQVENGGSVMPAFKGRLSAEQIEAVSQYVAQKADPNAKPPSGGGTP